MNLTQTGERVHRSQLRVWPGVVAAVLLALVWSGVPIVMQGAAPVRFLAGLACGLIILLWWVFFSRAPWLERLGAIALMIAGVAATRPMLDKSIAGAGMGMMFYMLAIPALSLALVVWAVTTRRLAAIPRRLALIAAVLLVCGAFALLRTDGITGDGRSQLAWRWSATPEQRLLARTPVEPPTPAPVAPPTTTPTLIETPVPKLPAAATPRAGPKAVTPAEWPGFRGPHRDSVVPGVQLNTDWASSPPVPLWRRPVGPGWSSFAVDHDRFYTQEQRGDYEAVACYNATTGEPVWTHRDTARFWESNGGAGPRGTPTLHGGRVYAFGATAILNSLDARSGALAWKRNAASDTGAKLPGWGFSSSPLVVDDLVIVAASGWLAAYDLSTGDPRWIMQTGGGSYSSPHLLTIAGVAQVVLLNGAGVTSVNPADGKVLWQHAWEGASILQPALTSDGGLLIATSDMSGGVGTRRLSIVHAPSGWTAQEVWTSKGLKPYFNDIVVHKGHAYGFDAAILSCIDLKDGARKWKGGRYGHGQMLLLPDQDLLLVLSEEGEIALVAATPEKFTELAKVPAIEGKTWNHPALVRDLLLVRNGEQMAAFRLPVALRSAVD